MLNNSMRCGTASVSFRIAIFRFWGSTLVSLFSSLNSRAWRRFRTAWATNLLPLLLLTMPAAAQVQPGPALNHNATMTDPGWAPAGRGRVSPLMTEAARRPATKRHFLLAMPLVLGATRTRILTKLTEEVNVTCRFLFRLASLMLIIGFALAVFSSLIAFGVLMMLGL